MVALVAIGGIYFFASQLPKKISTYEGISLGESKDSVFYALGPPTDVLFPPEDINSSEFWKRSSRVANKKEISEARNGVKSFNLWAFKRKETRLDVDFDNEDRVISIGCYYDLDKNEWLTTGACKANGIQLLDQEEQVKERLGSPDSEKIEDVTKTVIYKNLNMKLYFSRKILYFITITHSD